MKISDFNTVYNQLPSTIQEFRAKNASELFKPKQQLTKEHLIITVDEIDSLSYQMVAQNGDAHEAYCMAFGDEYGY